MFKHIRLAPIALLIVLLATTACRGRRTIVAKAPDAPPPPTEMADAVVAEADEGTVGEATPAPNPDAFADEIRNRSSIESDRARYLVRQKLDAARVHVDNYEYAKAEDVLREALALQPGNRDVHNELRIVQDLRGERGAGAEGFLKQQEQIVAVKIDEQKTKAAKLSNVGRMHLMNGRFDDAIETFEQALFIMTASPYEIDWGTLASETENGLRQSKYMKEQQAKQQRRESIEENLVSMAEAEEQHLVVEMQELELLMGAGIEAFQSNRFELAEDYANRVLTVQPDNIKARELAMAASRSQHEATDRQFLIDEKLRFREWMDDITATRVMQRKILKWPSQSFWQKITDLRRTSRPSFGGEVIDAEAEALKKQVAGTQINLSVDNQEFQQVVQTLQIQTNYNLVIDNRVFDDIAEQTVVGLFLQDVRMDTALNLLVTQAGEDVIWTTKGNVILFTTKENVKQNLVVQIHSVADLTAGLTDFIAPQIQLVGPDDFDEDNPLFGGESEEPNYPYGQVGELIELIQQSVAPTFWESADGASIAEQGEHAIVVKASPEVQEQVDQFLNDLRGFAGIVVTVETRFLEVGDAFLRDVGVDFRGSGGQLDGQGELVNLDDVTNGLEDASSAGFDNGGGGLATGAALSPSAGAYFGDGADGDFRGRTENIFDRPLGNILSALGGSTLTMSYLDDSEFTMILRATEKALQTRTLTAPRITVHNTQRANLTVVNQLSYIQDFDVEVAQTSFIADPIVGIIQDGLTLDVRPTISNDRRYITLELQPTVADLVEPIPTFATTLASSFAPVIIQLPELRLQQARTTVRIPDRGSILIGGLKNISTQDRQSVTPWIETIPILSFLFSRKGRSDEVTHLMILVRAEITDLASQEERLMGR